LISGFVVQNHVQQGTMDFQSSVVIDEAQFAEFVHEKANPGSGPIGITAVIETAQDLRLFAVYVLAMIGIVSLPLILLLPGLVIAWIARGFARTPHQQADA
jgi:hypothetical protein